MKAEQFYKSLNRQKERFVTYGFKKRNRNTYCHKEGVILKFLLDKWSWDELYGSAYQVRMIDEKRLDKYGNPILPTKDTLDIRTDHLLEKKLISNNELNRLYKKYPKQLRDRVGTDLYPYYDEKNLDDNLGLFLEPILMIASEWSLSREETRKHLPKKAKKPSEKELEESKKILDELFSDFK